MFDTEATFVTHVRVDSLDRLNNLQLILNFYSRFFPNSKFILIEDGAEHDKRFDGLQYPRRTSFYFLKNSGVYHRTKALNYGMFKATTSCVVSLDTDCIIDPKSLQACFNNISKQQASLAWPCNGYFIDTSRVFINANEHDCSQIYSLCYDEFIQIKNPTVGQITSAFSIRCTPDSHISKGGIVVFDTEIFTALGGYNEKFIGWGAEDDEIDTRYKMFQQPTYRDAKGVCFHIEHRGATRHSNPFYRQNCLESDKVGMMSLTELQYYISTWDWIPKK
jgi:hypothetical protein